MHRFNKRPRYSTSDDDISEEITSGSEYSPDDSNSTDDLQSPRPNRARCVPNVRPTANKRSKQLCTYKENCYRKNPEHFREFSHPHLEKILAEYNGSGSFNIPLNLRFQRDVIEQQLGIVKKFLIYPISTSQSSNETSSSNMSQPPSNGPESTTNEDITDNSSSIIEINDSPDSSIVNDVDLQENDISSKPCTSQMSSREVNSNRPKPQTPAPIQSQADGNKRKIEEFFSVVAPKWKMEEKHKKSAPYHIFFTTITSAKETHNQPLSITFQELLDPSLGPLQSSLQINFMVDIGWLLAQYYFAGYNNKPLTILYGDDSPDLKTINQKKPNVNAHLVSMKNAFGTHHTKMSILCYEDKSLRVVISTANLYIDDWENRTQGLWLSPRCPALADEFDVISGESPTGFKRSLINYLNSYGMPCLIPFIESVKHADFSAINVFLIASIPGSHFDSQWGLTRIGSLLSKHCVVPQDEMDKWNLVAQASSIGSFGAEPKLWLTGEFQANFCNSVTKTVLMTKLPQLKFIYPSFSNVKGSHDHLLGGGCLPYSDSIHAKQPWLNNFLQEWSAVHSGRNRAMPHIKSYLRISPDGSKASFFVLTSANVSKSAWGIHNKGNRALRINSYEVGVLFLPKFVISQDYFSIDVCDPNRLPVPYDLPTIPYSSGDIPWVMDYLR